MAPVIAYIADFLVEVGLDYAVAEVVAEVIVYVAATEIINAVTSSDAPDPQVGGEGGNLTANYAATDASIRLIIGTVRCGGMETLPPVATGTNGEMLHKVVTIAGHEVDSYGTTGLGEMYFEDEQITSGIAAISSSSGDGLLTTGKYANYAWIRRYTGASGETKDYILDQAVFAGTGNFVGRGMARAFLQYKWNRDVFTAVPVATFIVNGAKVYDPRLDTTNGGSGSHRYATPSTWEFAHGAETKNLQSIGSNPALQLAWYLMHVSGGEVDPTEIDWSTVITAANVCDAAVAIPDGHGSSTTQDRYTSNGILLASIDDWTDNLRPLVDAMLGSLVYANGVWRMYAGGWQTPTTSIVKSDWVSGVQYTFDGGRDARFNRSRVFYVDASRNFTKQECYARANATYQTADGGETIDLSTQQLLTVNEYEAQRKGEFLLRASRNQVIVSGRLPPRFQKVLLWDTVTVTDDLLGWSSKTFRVVSIKLNYDGSLDVGLREEQDTDWTDLLYTDYNAPSTVAIPAINPTTPSEPSSLSVVQMINGALQFDLGRSIVEPQNTLYRIIRSTSSIDASVGTVVWQGTGRHVELVMPTSPHWYYSQAVANSYVSAYQPNTFGVGVVARPTATGIFEGEIIPDPEVQYSARHGDFWVGVNTASAVWSISLSGGSDYGRLICKTQTFNPSPLSKPDAGGFGTVITQPYPRAFVNAPYRMLLRIRCTNATSNGTINKFVSMRLYGWSGVGSPDYYNASGASNLFNIGATAVTCHVSTTGGLPLLVDSIGWTDVVTTSTVGDGVAYNTNSYPFIVALINVNGYVGDVFEIDYARALML